MVNRVSRKAASVYHEDYSDFFSSHQFSDRLYAGAI